MSIPGGDLTLLRSNPHFSDLFLVIQQPEYSTDSGATWTGYDWSCRIDGAHTDDPTVTLTVDGGAAATDILDGMTILIGSAKYGDWDHGIYRVRGDQTVDGATVALDIGTSSEVRGLVEDDDYVVVLDEFRFWQRFGRIEIVADEPVWYKDYDITWADLGGTDAARRLAMMPPVPVMGPHAVKFVEIGGTASTFYYDWQDSYAPAVGETVATWTSEGEQDHAGNTWNSAAETPGWQTTDTISGLRGFRVTLEVDDGNGNAATLPYRRGVRYVFTLRRPGETQVGDPDNAEPITEFSVEPISGDFQQGYWSTSITVFETAATQYNIMPGALVILFTEDTYGTTAGSLGPIADRENILLIGRIVDGTIRENPETGDVTFDVASPGAEAAMYHNYPIVIQNDDAATDWINTPDLTIDRAVHYYTTWHTTLNLVADLYQTGSTIEDDAQDFLEGDIYSTLNQYMHDRLFARLLCDKYGRFHCEIDANEQAFGATTVLWTMQTADWLEEVNVRHRVPSPFNAAECGGIIYDGGTIVPKLSHAPGLFTKYRGAQDANTALAITSQATLNTTCGRHLEALNHEYEIDFALAGNWRYCDIAPQRVVDIGTLTTDRATLTGDYIIRSVTNTYDPVAGIIFTEIQTEEEAGDGTAGATIVIPENLPSRTPTTRTPRLPVNPGGPGGTTFVDLGRRIIATNVGVYATDNIGATNPVWYGVNTGLPADTTRNCWKILRDPWHWWTSGDTERTLWGIFSDPADNDRPRYVYKMEDFPYGTWTEVMDAVDFAFAPAHSGLYWVCDLVGSIEVEDLFYATIQHPTAGLTSSPGWLVNTANGGGAWNDLGQFTAVNTDGFPPWPGSTMTIDTGKHSAAQSVYIYQSFMIPGTDFAVRVTTNGGGAWATLTPNIGPWGADVDGAMFVPYHSASWGDTDLIVRTRNIANDAKGLQRSTDSGATWSNIGEANVGYEYRAGTGYTMNRLIYAALYGDGAATTVKYTVDAGANWTNWTTTAYPVGYAALFEFDPAGLLSSVLTTDITGGITPFAVHLLSQAQDLDKTGNLLTVASGIDTITRFERDTMGSA